MPVSQTQGGRALATPEVSERLGRWISETGPSRRPSPRLRLPKISSRFAAAVVAGPDLVAVGLAGFSVVAVALLLAGRYSPALVFPLGLLGGVAALCTRRIFVADVKRSDVVLTAVAFGICVLWVLLNLRYASQDIYARRDPATYNLAAHWLMTHESLVIPTQSDVFGSPSGADATSAGFGDSSSNTLYAQGNHLLPALMATGGWLFGINGILAANIVIAAGALFVFFGLARRIIGAGLGLVAMCAVAVSMPMLYVSRDSFTEPLAMLFLMGGLSLLHKASRTQSLPDYARAGLVAGISAAVRIDSYASILTLAVAALAIVALAGVNRHRVGLLRAVTFLGSGAAAMSLGWVDVTQLSSGYYHDQRGHIVALVAAGAVFIGVSPLLIAIAWRPRFRAAFVLPVVRMRAGRLVGIGVVATALFMWSRPMWQTTVGTDNVSLPLLQSAQGLAPDGTRLYNELTVNWLAMYLGWPTLVLGLVGYLVLTYRALRRMDIGVGAVLAMGLCMTALYLWTSQITPDQPWASRRYLPVVIPLLVIAAGAALRLLRAWFGRWQYVPLVAGSLAIIGLPAAASVPMLTVTEGTPQLAQLNEICRAVGSNGAVAMLDQPMQLGYGQAVRSVCGVPTTTYLNASSWALREMNRSVNASGHRLFVMTSDPSLLPGVDASTAQPFSSITTIRWPSLINTVPKGPASDLVVVHLAAVSRQGDALPVTPLLR